jgi:hypothetical protein
MIEKNLKVADNLIKLYKENGVVRMEIRAIHGWGARMKDGIFEGSGFEGDMFFSMSDIVKLYIYTRLPKYWSLANQFSKKALEIDGKVQRIVVYPQEKEGTDTIQLALKFIRYQPEEERMVGIIFLLPYHVMLLRAYLREFLRRELKETGVLVLEKHVKANDLDYYFQFIYDEDSLLIRENDKVYELYTEQVNVIREMTDIEAIHCFTPDREVCILPDKFMIGEVEFPLKFFEKLREFVSL